MSEEPTYSKRELDHYFADMKNDIKEILIDGKETKQQAYKTNGRVNKIEWQIKAFWWGLGVLWTLLALSLPTIIRFIGQVNRLNITVSQLNNDYEPER